MERHTDTHTYLLDSDLEVWIEPDAYCPRLIIKRPKKIKNTYTVLSQTMHPFAKIIRDDESLFLEDPLYNLVANSRIDNQVKLKTATQLKELAEKLERMIREKIDEEQIEDEDLWLDVENP
jgi:hypothetical protein